MLLSGYIIKWDAMKRIFADRHGIDVREELDYLREVGSPDETTPPGDLRYQHQYNIGVRINKWIHANVDYKMREEGHPERFGCCVVYWERAQKEKENLGRFGTRVPDNVEDGWVGFLFGGQPEGKYGLRQSWRGEDLKAIGAALREHVGVQPQDLHEVKIADSPGIGATWRIGDAMEVRYVTDPQKILDIIEKDARETREAEEARDLEQLGDV